ncbi:PREDICTED: uncharacterized protein LOC105457827, partial [Wasmannia auropunctata]|uniref:uncharacterized protein LOC105457827 n=1 Tax=Wasmannia auropunctata TaxID=64793 RepID=UPI0005EF1CFD
MVRRCCVPKCISKKDIPVHRLPRDDHKAKQWLRTIGRTDLIDASEKVLKELRICTLHFPEHMIFAHTKRRILKNDAIPSMHLSNDIEDINTNINLDSYTNNNINSDINLDSTNNSIMPYISASTSSVNNEAVENVERYSNFISIEKSKDKEVKEQKSQQEQKVLQSQIKTRRLKKCIYKKKKIIDILKQKKNLYRGNKWSIITADLTKSQKIFFDIIEKNLKREPK